MDTGGDFRPVRFMIWDHLFFFGWYKGRWNLFHFWEVQQGPTKITQLEGPPKGDLFIWGPTFVVHIMWKWLVGRWDDHIYCASRNCHRNPCGVQTPHFKASKINMASGTCQKPVWFQFGCSPKQPIPTGRIFMPSHARNIPQWMVMSLIIGPVYTLYLPCSIGDIPKFGGWTPKHFIWTISNSLELIGLTRCWFILSSPVVAYDDEACRWV